MHFMGVFIYCDCKLRLDTEYLQLFRYLNRNIHMPFPGLSGNLAIRLFGKVNIKPSRKGSTIVYNHDHPLAVIYVRYLHFCAKWKISVRRSHFAVAEAFAAGSFSPVKLIGIVTCFCLLIIRSKSPFRRRTARKGCK